VSGGASLETTRKGAPGLGFACGLDGKVERDEGNPIRVIRDAGIGRGGGATASVTPRKFQIYALENSD
jgi:hypothetical protein